MDVAVNVIVGFGSAILGAVVGFLGALYISRGQQKERHRGLIKVLEIDLSDNVGRMRGMQDRIRIPIHQRPVDLLGPPSSELWKALRVEIAGFLPLEMVFKLNVVYQELDVNRATFGVHPLLIDPTTAPELIEQWVTSAEDLQDQLMDFKGFETPMDVRESVIKYARTATERKQAVVAARTARMDAINDLMNGQKEQRK